MNDYPSRAARWLADFCSQAPGRLAGQALVLFDDVEQAVHDVYWAREHGLGGVMMPGLYPGGTYFFDPALDPVWAAIQETGLPVSQHGGAGLPAYSPPGSPPSPPLPKATWSASCTGTRRTSTGSTCTRCSRSPTVRAWT